MADWRDTALAGLYDYNPPFLFIKTQSLAIEDFEFVWNY
jgi:hypothetical protein